MTITIHGTHARIKANFAFLVITICVLLRPRSATSLSGRSDHQIKSESATQGQRVDVEETTRDPTTSAATNQNNLPNFLPNEPWPQLNFGLENPENGGLLIDPLHPLSSTLSPDEVQLFKPSKIISSVLLTAATPSPTAPKSSLIFPENSKNHPSHDWNDARKFPILSGSMTISLPTATPPVPASVSAGTSFIAPNALSSKKVQENMTSTPTTSTAIVYATNSPVSSSLPSSAMNSSSSCTAFMSSYKVMSCGLLVFLIMWVHQ